MKRGQVNIAKKVTVQQHLPVLVIAKPDEMMQRLGVRHIPNSFRDAQGLLLA